MITSRVPRLSLRSLAAGLAAAGLLACTSHGNETAPTGAMTLGASAEDLAAISRVHQQYVAAHNDSDADRLVALFTEDAVLMPMDEPSLSGRQAIREHYEEFFDQNPSAIELSPVETRVAGDWAFERIQVKVTLPDGKGDDRHADVKYLWILQRQPDRSWKIARAIYNLDGNIDDEEGAVARGPGGRLQEQAGGETRFPGEQETDRQAPEARGATQSARQPGGAALGDHEGG